MREQVSVGAWDGLQFIDIVEAPRPLFYMKGLQKRIRLGSLAENNTGTIINIPKILSEINMKYVGHTDSDGDVYSFPYRLVFRPTGVPSASNITEVITTEIPNHWKVRNAVKKWHYARREMFSRAGVSDSELGAYGKLLRPYMDRAHAAGAYAELLTFDFGNTGSWNYSNIASNLDWPSDFAISNFVTLDMIDQYTLHVCDGHTIDTEIEGVEEYTSVGMVLSYNQDRQGERIADPTHGESFSKVNPLASLMSNDATGGEVSDIALALQVEEPPYDRNDDGDSIETVTTGTNNGSSTGRTFSISGLATAGYVLLTSNLPMQVYLEVGEPILAKEC